MGKVRVKAVLDKDPYSDQVQNPILVRFQHATTSRESSSLDLNQIFGTAVFHSDPVKSQQKDFSHLDRSKKQEVDMKPTRNRKRKLVALQSSSMTYIGTDEDDEPLRTYMAVRQGQHMQVFEVTPVTVTPFIKGHSFVVEQERQRQPKKTQIEKKEAAIDLVKSFGSKRKRLTYERLEKNQIDVVDMNESMSKASAQISAADDEPIIKDDSMVHLMPPCHRKAKTAEEVYNLDDIITPEEMNDMDGLSDEFLNLSTDVILEWQNSKKFSDYFFAMWHSLSSQAPNGKTIYCAKLVLYTELLICLLKLRHDQLRKKTVELPDVFPMWMQEKALETFTSTNAKGVRNRPEHLKDKTCCYVMVLVLLANNFIFDVQLMSTSLNLHIKKLLTLAKAVGISLHYNSIAKEHRGVLKVPLPKPIETRGRRRALR